MKLHFIQSFGRRCSRNITGQTFISVVKLKEIKLINVRTVFIYSLSFSYIVRKCIHSFIIQNFVYYCMIPFVRYFLVILINTMKHIVSQAFHLALFEKIGLTIPQIQVGLETIFNSYFSPLVDTIYICNFKVEKGIPRTFNIKYNTNPKKNIN